MFLNKFEDFVCKQVTSRPAHFLLEVLGCLDLVMVSVVDDEIECCISHDKRWTMTIEGGPTVNCSRFSFPPVLQSVLQLVVVFLFGIFGKAGTLHGAALLGDGGRIGQEFGGVVDVATDSWLPDVAAVTPLSSFCTAVEVVGV